MNPYIDIHSHSRTSTAALRIVNSDPERFDLDLATFPYLSIGVHPWRTGDDSMEQTLGWVAEHAAHPKVLAIGECGLDRLRGADLARQEMIFERQIGVAEARGKPLILHCVRAFDLLGRRLKANKPHVPLIVHGFDQNLEIARQLARLSVYLSFGRALLRPQSNACKVMQRYPRSLIFLETDDADSSIEEIYRVAADMLGIEECRLVEQVGENFSTLFGAAL